jgi:hypothetical protein
MSAFGAPSQTVQGVIRAEDVTLDFGAGGGKGALVQQAQLTCQRTVNMIYEIGSSNVYYVGDRRNGQAQFSRIVGGSADFKTMVSNYGNICTPKPLKMNVGAASCGPGGGGGAVTYTMVDATLNSLGASVTAQEIVVTETMGFIFADLEYT